MYAPLKKKIHPGQRAYLPLGCISAGLIAIWMSVWIYRGPQTGAWQPILLIASLYLLWCFVLWRRVLTINEIGITCTYPFRKPRRVAWIEIRRSVVTLWMDRRPYQILIYGDAYDRPLLDIPLRLYDEPDVAFLMSLKELRIEKVAA